VEGEGKGDLLAIYKIKIIIVIDALTKQPWVISFLIAGS